VERRKVGRISRISPIAFVAVFAAVFALAHASVGPPEQTGKFALLGGTPKVVSKFWARMGSGLTSELNVAQYPIGSTAPILNYSVEMQRTMHMVVIRDDFATFDHLHPAFNTTTGAFIEKFTKEPNHRYYLYADSTPVGLPQQVFRFTMESDGPLANDKPSLAASLPSAIAGPYTVALDETTLPANAPHSLDVTIDKGGHPAEDLGSYLGAASHAVFINTTTLQYVHVHSMAGNTPSGKGPIHMNMTGTGPRQHVELPALPAGTYKMWLQFRGAQYKIYTVSFTLAVQ
jgi:hypothetical protein